MTRRLPSGWGGAYLRTSAFLESFPFIDPTYPRAAKATLREIVFRSYRIFYDVSEESHTVEIVHVWHGARDEPTF